MQLKKSQLKENVFVKTVRNGLLKNIGFQSKIMILKYSNLDVCK